MSKQTQAPSPNAAFVGLSGLAQQMLSAFGMILLSIASLAATTYVFWATCTLDSEESKSGR